MANDYQEVSSGSENEMRNKVSERLKQIQFAMENISSSDDFKKYLEVMGKFHDYSLNNTILIALQKPEATLVAGYNQWMTRFDRHVKSGEKGLDILAPTEGKKHFLDKSMLSDEQYRKFLAGDPIQVNCKTKEGKEYSFATSVYKFAKTDIEKFMNGEKIREAKAHTYFRPVKVFDVSQTDGKELPKNPLYVNELQGTVGNYDAIMSAIQKVAPCNIEFASAETDPSLGKGAKGYFIPSANRIVIKEGMSQLQTIKTAVHETAHAMLHNTETLNKLPLELRPDRRDKEIQAESVACATCYYFGIDTSEYSFNYVASWASLNTEKFKASMQLIRDTSSQIIKSIDQTLYPEKHKQIAEEREQAKEKRAEYAKNKAKSKSSARSSKSKMWEPPKATQSKTKQKEYAEMGR